MASILTTVPESTESTAARSVGKYPQIAVSLVVFSTTGFGKPCLDGDVNGAASLVDVMAVPRASPAPAVPTARRIVRRLGNSRGVADRLGERTSVGLQAKRKIAKSLRAARFVQVS
jgi:hypothetical protein